MSGTAVCSCTDSRYVTVGCRVHHKMPDGCLAADREVSCEGCAEFFCDHDCAWYDEIDPDVPADERGETFLCAECGQYGTKNGTVRKQEGR